MSDHANEARMIAQRLNSWKYEDGSENLSALWQEAKHLGQKLFDEGGKPLLVRMLNELKTTGIYTGALDKEWECFYY